MEEEKGVGAREVYDIKRIFSERGRQARTKRVVAAS
jgi:hypothetical protein